MLFTGGEVDSMHVQNFHVQSYSCVNNWVLKWLAVTVWLAGVTAFGRKDFLKVALANIFASFVFVYWPVKKLHSAPFKIFQYPQLFGEDFLLLLLLNLCRFFFPNYINFHLKNAFCTEANKFMRDNTGLKPWIDSYGQFTWTDFQVLCLLCEGEWKRIHLWDMIPPLEKNSSYSLFQFSEPPGTIYSSLAEETLHSFSRFLYQHPCCPSWFFLILIFVFIALPPAGFYKWKRAILIRFWQDHYLLLDRNKYPNRGIKKDHLHAE